MALSTLALSGAVRPTVLLELDTTGASLAAYLDDGDDWRPRRARCSVLELVNAGPRTPEDWDRELARVSQPLGTFSSKAELIVGVPHPAQGSALSGSFAASLIAELERRFETVLLDLGDEPVSGSGVEAAVTATALQAADWVLVVTTPEPASLHRARLAIVEAGDALDRSRAAVVINRLDRRYPISIDRVEVGLGLPVIACMPLDYQAAQRAQADAQPVVCDTGSKLRKPLAQLLERLNGDPLASAELVGRSGPGVSTLRRLRAAAAPLLVFGGSR